MPLPKLWAASLTVTGSAASTAKASGVSARSWGSSTGGRTSTGTVALNVPGMPFASS